MEISIKDVRAYRGADVGSDHYMLGAKIKIKLQGLKRRKRSQPFDLGKLKNPANVEHYQSELTRRFKLSNPTDLEEQWKQLKKIVNESAEDTLGRKKIHQRKTLIQEKT